MKNIRKILCIVLVLTFGLIFCGCNKEPEQPEDQIIYYNVDFEPVTLDPQIANDSSARLIIMNIFEGLVRIDKENNITPGAAESWEISGDKMMYTFHLRDGLKWNDGSELTAEDFVYGIQRTLQPQTSSPTASTLYCIKNAKKVNKGEAEMSTLGIFVQNGNTIIFQLEYPDSDFLQILATAPAMPCNRTFFEQTAGQYGREDDKLLCNGAFFVRESGWGHDEYIYLRKNTEYVGEDSPIPAGVNISIGNTPADVCGAIADGTIDCGSITSAYTERAELLGFHLTSFGDTVWGISFNTSDEILADKNIRYSLLSAIDREYILKEIPENCIETTNIIPSSAELDEQQYRKIAGNVSFEPDSDPNKLLEKGLKETKLDTLPNITILCTDDEKTQAFVNNIIETWNNFTGGYFNKKPVPLSELKDRIEDGNFEAVIAPLTIQGNTPLSTLELFESTSKYNSAMFSSEDYDEMVSGIRKNLTSSEAENIRSAEQYLLDNGIFYPLYIENRYYASAANVEGIIFHPFGAEADFFYAKKIVE